MALQAISLPTTNEAAMGQWVKSSFQFQSNALLTGKVMRFSPALWSDLQTGTPTEFAFQSVLTGSAGTSDMSYIGILKNKNYRAELEEIDGKNFKIHLYYMFVSDLDGFVGETAMSNFSIFNDSIAGASSVYTAQKNLLFYVDVNAGEETAIGVIPSIGKSFCSRDDIAFTYYDTNDLQVTGFQPGDDFKIKFTTPTSSVGNNFFCGWYREDSIAGGQDFITDLGLNLAQISNAPVEVDADIPFTCFSTGKGFISDGTNFVGEVVIAGSCLQANATYRVYIVYQVNGAWYSCRSTEILQSAATKPAIYGDFACEVTDEFDSVHADCCVTGLTGISDVEVFVKMDRTTYDSALASAGLSGNMNDYFVQITATKTNIFPTSAQSVGGIGISGIATEYTTGGIGARINFTPDGSASKYIVFGFEFDYGALGKDYIYQVVQLGFSAIGAAIDPTITQGGNPVTDIICAEEEDPVIVTYTDIGGTCSALVSVDGSIFQENASIVSSVSGTTLTLNALNLILGSNYCFKVICTDTPAVIPGETCCDCPIPSANGYIIQEALCAEDITCPVRLEVHLTDLMKSQISTFEVIRNGTTTYYWNGGGAGNPQIIDSFDETPAGGGYITANYSITVVLTNGCQYQGGLTVFNSPHDASRFYFTLYNNDCIDDSCLEATCAQNEASIDFGCDPDTQTITVSTSESLSSPVDTDDFECSTDGISFSPCSSPYAATPKLFVRRNIVFTDGCAPVNIEQVISCLEDKTCQNGAEVQMVILPTSLTLTNVNDFTSGVLSDITIYSIDGGVNFDTYVSPVALLGGEEIIYKRTIIFDDGCPDILLTDSGINDETYQCDYSQYILNVYYDDNSATFYIAVVGDEALLVSQNDKDFSLDGGATWNTYSGAVAGELFMLRWTMKFNDACDDFVLVKAIRKPCPGEAGPLEILIVNDCETPVAIQDCCAEFAIAPENLQASC